jgi:hypothetical protein
MYIIIEVTVWFHGTSDSGGPSCGAPAQVTFGPMLPVVVLYAGLITGLVGLVWIVKPLTFAGLRKRRHGVWLLVIGSLIVLLGWNSPAKEIRITAAHTELDLFVPVYQFSEFHSIRVLAPKDRVYDAVKRIRADEILLFRTLTWMRRFGRSGPESILNAPENMPILEVATRTTFLTLAERPGEELLVGTTVSKPRGAKVPQTPQEFRALAQPGFALAAMNFRLEDGGASTTVVSTETRVYATDDYSRRRFARYWRTIYPGSAFMRRMWLHAIKRRAEAAS